MLLLTLFREWNRFRRAANANSSDCERSMEAGYLYVLVNPTLPGMVKIGRTARSPAERAAELSTATGVPTPFIVAFEQAFDDCCNAEAYVHEVLSQKGHRTSSNREFFNISATEAITAILATPGKLNALTPTAREDTDSTDVPYWKSLVEDAEAHLYGLGEYLVDERKAAKLLEKAINFGGLTAYPLLSLMYTQGWGVRKDSGYANDLLRQGIAAGNPFCAWKLGTAYLLSMHELDDGSKAHQQFQSDADKCFRRWISEMAGPDTDWTDAAWYDIGITEELTRDLFHIYEAGTIPDYLRPMFRVFRGKIIEMVHKNQAFARSKGNHGQAYLDKVTNSLGRFESEEL